MSCVCYSASCKFQDEKGQRERKDGKVTSSPPYTFSGFKVYQKCSSWIWSAGRRNKSMGRGGGRWTEKEIEGERKMREME